jgi:UDP-N-acetyl-D-glucosamine dehydrogenase
VDQGSSPKPLSSHDAANVDALLDRLDNRDAHVAILGQGYVGLVVAMRASEAGFPVIGYEPDRRRYEALCAARSYVVDVPDETLQAALDRGYRPTNDPADIAGYDVAVISVPTPLHEGLPDLSFVTSAAEVAGDALRPGALVVLESTTYPGTTEELVAPILEQRSNGLQPGTDYFLGYSPERIDPGNPHYGLTNTPKVISGVDDDSLEAVRRFFGAFVEKLVPMDSTADAELVKLIENTFRHVNIALMNELAVFAAELGMNVWKAVDAAATKPFGFMPFYPGPGVGGHCLPVDPSYLSWRVKRRLGQTFRFVELANEVNDHMPSYVVRRIGDQLNKDGKALRGSRVLVLGLAYKPNTGDARESPSLPVIEGLRRLGADVAVAEPHVEDMRLDADIERVECTPDEVRRADVVIVITDHDEFDYDMVQREAARIFDTRNRYRDAGAAHVERL